MRIKVLLNLGAGLPRFMADEIHEVTEEVGRMLVRQHWAIELPAEPVAITPPVTSQAPAVFDSESPVSSPATGPDKFEAMRQHPDHVTAKNRPPRKRASKPSTETETLGE